MARKKKSNLPVIFYVAQAFALFFSYISPAIIAILWLYTEIKMAVRFKAAGVEHQMLLQHIASEQSSLESTFDAGLKAGLRKRSDGFFDARSHEGRECNSFLNEIQSSIDDLRVRFNLIDKALAQRTALRAAVSVWIAASLVMWVRHDRTFDHLSFLISGLLATTVGGLAYFIKKHARA